MNNSDLLYRKSSFFSNKITIIQFVLSLFVFFIHFRTFSAFDNASGILSTLFDILISMTHVAVPLFFAISAALFYRNYTLSLTLRKWKRRFFSLCIPYLVWNTIWLILAILGYYTPLGNYLGGVKTLLTVESVLTGIFLYRFFEPFWFMCQLIILTFLCPVIYLLLKNKVIGVFTIVIFSVFYFLNIFQKGILIRNPCMVIAYLIGAWIGMHHFDWISTRRTKNHAMICFLIFIACCFFTLLNHHLPQWMSAEPISFGVRIISCVAFFISFDLFSMKSCPDYMKNSFLIYAMHSLIGASFAKIVCIILPSGDLFALLTAIISFIATVIFICIFGKLLERYTPKLKRILVGR